MRLRRRPGGSCGPPLTRITCGVTAPSLGGQRRRRTRRRGARSHCNNINGRPSGGARALPRRRHRRPTPLRPCCRLRLRHRRSSTRYHHLHNHHRHRRRRGFRPACPARDRPGRPPARRLLSPPSTPRGRPPPRHATERNRSRAHPCHRPRYKHQAGSSTAAAATTLSRVHCCPGRGDGFFPIYQPGDWEQRTSGRLAGGEWWWNRILPGAYALPAECNGSGRLYQRSLRSSTSTIPIHHQ